MKTRKITYVAPEGDSKVCETNGLTFYDGVAVEIEDNADSALFIYKLWHNQHFKVSGDEPDDPRPPVPVATYEDADVGPRAVPAVQIQAKPAKAAKAKAKPADDESDIGRDYKPAPVDADDEA